MGMSADKPLVVSFPLVDHQHVGNQVSVMLGNYRYCFLQFHRGLEKNMVWHSKIRVSKVVCLVTIHYFYMVE